MKSFNSFITKNIQGLYFYQLIVQADFNKKKEIKLVQIAVQWPLYAVKISNLKAKLRLRGDQIQKNDY